MTAAGVERIRCIGVVGSGTMGRGIAQIAAAGGLAVRIFDQRPDAAAAAVAEIDRGLAGLVAKGRLDADARSATLARLQTVGSLDGLAGCDLVVEAIVESLAEKQALFRALEACLADDAVLATNTSSLSVTAIAAACARPEQVVGWHFFNPVPQVRIAEVVAGLRTAPALPGLMLELTARLGHRGVPAPDVPGFIVNHAGRAFIPEGLRLASEGIASFDQIDRVLRDCAGFRMGPFELADLVGLDNACDVMESLYHLHYEEPRFRITPQVRTRVAAGLLGRKSGEGFYRYDGGRRVDPPEAAAAATAFGGPVWIDSREPDLAARVRALLAPTGAPLEDTARPSDAALIVVTPVGQDTSSACAEGGLDARRTVAVDALFSLEHRCPLMAAPALDPARRAAATALFAATGRAVTWLRDSPGFVSQRMVSQIVQIACDMAQHRLAEPEQIDAAVTRALGYPFGPFAWAERLGAARVLQITTALQDSFEEPRYRPSVWLRRRVSLALPADHPD